jgi:hypothetical protein
MRLAMASVAEACVLGSLELTVMVNKARKVRCRLRAVLEATQNHTLQVLQAGGLGREI